MKFKKLIFIALLLVVIIFLIFILSNTFEPKKMPYEKEYECPNMEWVDCMPPYYDEIRREYCIGEYFEWMNKNCNVSFAY